MAVTTTPPKYQGVWASLRKIGLEEGFRGYFRGNGANCARVFPYTALQFAAYVRRPFLLARCSFFNGEREC